MNTTQRSAFTHDQLTRSVTAEGLVDNTTFLPAADAGPARHRCEVELALAEAPMQSNKPMLSATRYVGLRADLFPGVRLQFTTDGDALIPLDRDLLRAADGDSYWDITVSPGRIWSEPGDSGLSRAVFPFQLSNILENDTHHGLATFLYDDGFASDLQFQIAVQTKRFVVPDEFDAWGVVPVTRAALSSESAVDIIAAFSAEVADRLPLRPLADLSADVPENLMQAVHVGFGSDSAIVNGLVINEEVHATDCFTRAGNFPFPREMKFGIWSATKTAFGAVAWLRLAQITGEDCREARVAELLPEAEGIESWSNITIGDCLNMATGIGTAAPEAEPLDVFADYILEEERSHESEINRLSYDHYFAWFLALPQGEKNRAAFACTAYPWGAGEVARYRDQDLYIAGAAMDAWLKLKCGPQAKLWNMVRDEVYAPCGIRHAVKFQTVETEPSQTVPLTDAGLLLSMEDVARLGRLFHDGGRCDGEQILHPRLLAEVADQRVMKGLPTGTHTTDGEIHYHAATWHLPYRSRKGELFWLPTMRGYGGQTIQILPNGMTAFRFAFDSYDVEERYDALTLARIADAVRAF